MPKTIIEVTISIQRPGEQAQVFIQRAESDAATLWPAIVIALELVMSKVHRVLFPDTEEAEDTGNPTSTNNRDAQHP